MTVIFCCLFAVNITLFQVVTYRVVTCCCHELHRQGDVSNQMFVLEYVLGNKLYIGDPTLLCGNKIVTLFRAMIKKLLQIRSFKYVCMFPGREDYYPVCWLPGKKELI